MIEFSVADEAGDAEVLISGVTAGGVAEAPDDLGEHLVARGFKADLGATVLVPRDGGGARLLVGLGDADEVDARAVRRASAAASRSAGHFAGAATTLLADAGRADADGAQALAEGFALGAYRFGEYKSDFEPHLLTSVAVLGVGDGVADGLARGATIAAAVNEARDLVNEPGGSLTPPAFADRAVALGEANGVAVDVLDKAGIEAAGLGGLLGVNRGSFHEPRFIRMTHAPEGATGHVVLVGKGITFDAGGLSIKTADGMVGMNGDMGGGAAVIATMSAVAELAPGVKVTGLVPTTDNMLGPDATRPGDVLTIADGSTVEVLNTDAEGRLILADGLAVASQEAPDAIIDLATLTGACMVALGPRIAGLMSNDDAFADRVASAADAAGERVWRLPLPDDLNKELESPVADLKNIGKRWGGALTAGLFLQHFVGDDIPWVHLDIAGPAWLDDADGENPKNGTGFGVRTLLQLLSTWSD
jgi:leucyl aminopeptidase